jgi:tetratricopeptide (TPR) repeat protein
MRAHRSNLAKGMFSKAVDQEHPADGIRFEIWSRQWEICDLIAARGCAISLAEKFTDLARRDKNYTADAYYYRSAVSVNKSEFKEALDLAREGLKIAQAGDDPRKEAQLLVQCGKCCYQLGDFAGSLAHWQNIDEMATLRGMADIQALAFSSIGMIYWKTGRYQEALDVLSKAERSYHDQRNLRYSALTLQSIGNVLLGLDRTEQALEVYTRSRGLAQQIGDLILQSALLNNIGSIRLRQGHLSQAKEAYEQGLKIDRMLGNRSGQAKKLNNLGILLSTLGKQQMALEYTLKALEIDTSTGNLDGQMAKMGNISSMWQDLGDNEKALQYINQGIELSQKVGNQAFLGQFLGLKVNIDLRMGRPEEAIRAGEAALEINRRIGNRSYQVRALIYLHEVYLSLKQPQTALQCSTQALELATEADLFEAETEDVYFAHYRSLNANGRPGESLSFLESAYREVMRRAGGIEDPEGREYFLHGDPLHRRIIQEWEKNGSNK